MIRLRNVCTAFLRNGGDYLLMKRADSRKIGPGLWYGVGGHMEPDEISSPQDACLREILEETGIPASEIVDLQHRYIVMRRSGDKIVVNHFFFGQTGTRTVTASEEGALYWVPEREVLDRPFFNAIRLTLAHYLESGGQMAELLVGTVDQAEDPLIRWTPLRDMSQEGRPS